MVLLNQLLCLFHLKKYSKDDNYELVTREIFGPFQIVTEYKDNQLPLVLDALERMHAHLTAAVVSNDLLFLQEVIGNTVNGTTYAGLRARTTVAPQNHWFDLLAAEALIPLVGTEAISYHLDY